MNVSLHLLAAVLGYLVGSIPAAYFFVRWKANLDIRKEGSGNVGTLNSYEVTQSKLVGVSVLLLDVVKGVLAVVVGWLLADEFSAAAVAALGAVLGHNFPVWLRFKGGRGLATAAGAMLMLGWFILPVWMATWFLAYKISRDVNIGNAVATLMMMILPFTVPAELLRQWIMHSATPEGFRLYIVLLALLILVRLIDPVREYFAQRAVKT